MRLVAKASFFICYILLCGVGLYFFAKVLSTVVVVKDEWNCVASQRGSKL